MRLGKPLAKGYAEEEPLVQAESDEPTPASGPVPSEQPSKHPDEVPVAP